MHWSIARDKLNGETRHKSFSYHLFWFKVVLGWIRGTERHLSASQAAIHHHDRHASASAMLLMAMHHCSLPTRLLCKLSCHWFWAACLTAVQQISPAGMCEGVPRCRVRSHVCDTLRMEGLWYLWSSFFPGPRTLINFLSFMEFSKFP